MRKILEELIEVTYKAGYLHGKGLIGYPEQMTAARRSKELFQQLMEHLKSGAPDKIDNSAQYLAIYRGDAWEIISEEIRNQKNE